MTLAAVAPYPARQPETLEDIGARLAGEVAACTREIARCHGELRRQQLAGAAGEVAAAILATRIADLEGAVLDSLAALRRAGMARTLAGMAAAEAAGPPPRPPLHAV